MQRRGFLALAGSTALATSLARSGIARAAAAPSNSAASDPLVDMLRDPPASVRPQIRWWWPGGTISPDEITREANQIAEAGFGGFEIADVRDSVNVPIDPATLGWASPAWNRGVEAALEAAAKKNITPSLTLGPHWPTGIPGVMPDDPAASKEMVHGLKALAGGERFKGAVPTPVLAKPSGALPVTNDNPPVTPVLLAVHAYRKTGERGGITQLDPASRVDLTARVRDGALKWSAPTGGEWLLLSFWERGTGQIQNMFGMNKSTSMLADPTPYVLDIYGPAAVSALTRYWDEKLLSPRIRELMRQAGGTFFEDSLEMSAACPWTPTAMAEFTKRQGYDLTPYLPLLVSRAPTMEDIISGSGRPRLFEFTGVDSERVRHDFDATLSAMYVENRLQGLSAWAHKLGMKFRVQAIGSEINSGLAAAYADIPEGDNSNDIHGWRKLAAGRDIGGKTILSDEAATFVQGIAHVATWRDALYMLQRDMVGGANQIMLHGFSYADAPVAQWPGFSAFGRSIGNDWGPRDPQWVMAPGVTAYLGRMQALLREGRTHADLAVLGEELKSQSVLHAGYTFQYPAMELFTWPRMEVRDKILMPEGPGYRAIVLNALEAIDLAVAQRLEEHVAAGLPLVVVGKPPMHDRSWHDHAAHDEAIGAIFERLRNAAGVRFVARQAEVPAALCAMGVASLVTFSKAHRILALNRTTDAFSLFYLLNDGDTATSQSVSFVGDSVPYRVDLWSGALLEMPARRNEGKTTVVLDLAVNEPAMVILGRAPVAGAIKPPSLPAQPASQSLGPWKVDLDEWLQPASGMTIRHASSSLELADLKPWRALPGHEGMAGVARYVTTLRLAAPAQAGATIDLGTVEGAATVSVNGSEAMPVNPFTSRAVIGKLLKRGANTITITVASPLNNRLVADGIEEQGFKPPIDQSDAPPPPPGPKPEPDPDMVDGPVSMTGMQPGAAPPGSKRVYRDYGLLGPVTLLN